MEQDVRRLAARAGRIIELHGSSVRSVRVDHVDGVVGPARDRRIVGQWVAALVGRKGLDIASGSAALMSVMTWLLVGLLLAWQAASAAATQAARISKIYRIAHNYSSLPGCVRSAISTSPWSLSETYLLHFWPSPVKLKLPLMPSSPASMLVPGMARNS